MKTSPQGDLTCLLKSWSEGNPDAEAKLWPLVFSELKSLARRQLANQRQDHSLQSGALLNELYLRLRGMEGSHWESLAKFFALCAQVMRQILIDHARSRHSQKRGGNSVKVPLDDVVLISAPRAVELLALDDAMNRLGVAYPRKSQVVEMRFFGGLSFEEIAEVLGVSRLTV